MIVLIHDAKDVMQEILELMREENRNHPYNNSGIPSCFKKYIATSSIRGQLTPVRLKDFQLIPPPLERGVSKTVHLRSWQEALEEYLKRMD